MATREEKTKQEWVQKYLEDILADAWRKGTHSKGIDVTEEADKARLHLSKWGVVIKVENQTIMVSFPADGRDTGLKVPYDVSNLGDGLAIVAPLV